MAVAFGVYSIGSSADSQPARRAIRLLAGLAVALGFALVASPPARAEGCAGHRGYSVASMVDPMAGFDLLSRYGGLVPEPSPRPKTSCSGPSCSGRPMAPLPAAPATIAVHAEHWGCLVDPGAIPPRQRTPHPAAEPAPRSRHQGPSIFHPPRLGPPF